VFPFSQSNISDSLSNNNSAGLLRENRISSVNANESTSIVFSQKNGEVKDTLIASTSQNILFKVPYRCMLNRDSLKIEMRKVVLEIDTMPKGLVLVANKSLKDTTQLSSIKYSKSLFANHLLVPKNLDLKPKVVEQHHWIAFTIVFVLLLIAILRVFHQKKFSLFINAFISKRFSNQIVREENALTQTTSVLLSIVFLISISLFFYLVSQHYHYSFMDNGGWQNFGFIFLACLIFYFLKFIANKFGGYLFKVNKETDEYIVNQFLVLQIMGLVLTVLCILLSYGTNINQEYVIYVGISVLAIGFIVRTIKSLGIVNMNSYSPVYIFLYLCTLEILPLIVIFKLIV
jgi:hypothetical protein